MNWYWGFNQFAILNLRLLHGLRMDGPSLAGVDLARLLFNILLGILASFALLFFFGRRMNRRAWIAAIICIPLSFLLSALGVLLHVETKFSSPLSETVIAAVPWLLLFVPFAFIPPGAAAPRWLRERRWVFLLLIIGAALGVNLLSFGPWSHLLQNNSFELGLLILVLAIAAVSFARAPTPEQRRRTAVFSGLYLCMGLTILLLPVATYGTLVAYVILGEMLFIGFCSWLFARA